MRGECDGCGYETEVELVKSEIEIRGEEFHLCKICMNTVIGNAAMYPHQYKGELTTLRLLGFLANLIIDEMNVLYGGYYLPDTKKREKKWKKKEL